jgi:hypothetical protein
MPAVRVVPPVLALAARLTEAVARAPRVALLVVAVVLLLRAAPVWAAGAPGAAQA